MKPCPSCGFDRHVTDPPEGRCGRCLVLLALSVNAEREHFHEMHDGFNDCEFYSDKPCNCGKAEAEEALAWLTREVQS